MVYRDQKTAGTVPRAAFRGCDHPPVRSLVLAIDLGLILRHLSRDYCMTASAGGASAPAAVVSGQPQRKRRKMSAAARKRISEATKKRWAAFRKAAGARG